MDDFKVLLRLKFRRDINTTVLLYFNSLMMMGVSHSSSFGLRKMLLKKRSFISQARPSDILCVIPTLVGKIGEKIISSI